MPAVLEEINCVDESILALVEDLALIGIEKLTACARTQCLPAKRRLLVKTKLSVKTADHILVVYKLPESSEETNEGIGTADVPLEAENAHGCILIKKSCIDTGTFVFAEVTGTVVRGEQ